MPYDTLFDSRDNQTGLSGNIWKYIPANVHGNERASWFWRDRFLEGHAATVENTIGGALTTAYESLWITPSGTYGITQATAGTVIQEVNVGNEGVIVVNSGATTSGQGITMQGGPKVMPTAGYWIGIEARLKINPISTAPQFWFGLTKPDTVAPLTGGATLVVNTTNVTDAVGFVNLAAASNNPSASVYSYNDKATETAEQSAAAIDTLVADTYVKYGILIEGVTRAKYFVNGELVYTFTPDASNTLPVVSLQPSWVCQTDGTVQPILYMDDLAVGVSVI